jgi:hypothetical protein
LRHDEISTDIIELREMPDWVRWMRDELARTGNDLPTPETCMDFVQAAIRLAQRVRKATGHLPTSLRNHLIEAAILHQCWKRQTLSRKGDRRVQVSRIATLDALEFVQHTAGNNYLMTTADGNEYEVKFPSPQREFALATEVAFSAVAQLMGISVPPFAVVSVDVELAARAGIRGNQSKSKFWGGTLDSSRALLCLGLRSEDILSLDGTGRSGFPPHSNTFGSLIGISLLNVLALNTIQQRQSFKNLNGRAEVVFTDFSHCALGADWGRFTEAKNKGPIPCAPLNQKIRSYEQLEPWIRRAEQADLDQVCELLIKLPACWYGNRPAMAVAIVEKLRHRIANLRPIILNLIESGYFQNIKAKPGKSLFVNIARPA